MFLRNWYNLLKASCYGNTDDEVQVVNTSGSSFSVYSRGYSTSSVSGYTHEARYYLPSSSDACFPQNASSNNYPTAIIGTYNTTTLGSGINNGVFFGSDITPPTVDDYCLNGLHTSGLSVVQSGSARVIQGNSVTVEYSYTLKNTGTADVLIGEIGLCSRVRYNNGTSSSISSQSTHNVLIDRTVLDEPVTIAPGTMEVITYTLVYNLPSPD